MRAWLGFYLNSCGRSWSVAVGPVGASAAGPTAQLSMSGLWPAWWRDANNNSGTETLELPARLLWVSAAAICQEAFILARPYPHITVVF